MNLTPTQTKAPTTRDVLSALQSFRAFYESGQGYSMLGRATFGALCGKLTQRESHSMVIVRTRTVTLPALPAPAPESAHATTQDGPAQVYTTPARRFGGNVRRREGDVRTSPSVEFLLRAEGQI